MIGTDLEGDLVRRIAGGEESALIALYDRYGRLLFGLVLAILGDRGDAEEVLQEIFLQVWDRAAGFDVDRGSVLQWLILLARSRALDRRRGRNYLRRRQLETGLDAHAFGLQSPLRSPLDAAVLEERGALVRRLLERIPPEQRQVMHLAYFLGYTHREIARQLELPLGTVKSRLRLGLLALRDLLAAESASERPANQEPTS